MAKLVGRTFTIVGRVFSHGAKSTHMKDLLYTSTMNGKIVCNFKVSFCMPPFGWIKIDSRIRPGVRKLRRGKCEGGIFK